MNIKKTIDIDKIRNSIQQLDVTEEGVEFMNIMIRSDLLSLTEPIFFTELEKIILQIKKDEIEGCILEAGVWSGATAIFMKAILETNNIDKNIWLLDSFGTSIDLSIFKKEKDKKAIQKFTSWTEVKTPTLTDVKNNFNRFGLLDEKIKFIQGDIFKTYSQFEEEKIALLRLDLDFYESTQFMLTHFYSKVTKGGYIIIDDYGVEEFNCKEAVDEFRMANNITDPLISVGNFVAYWKKTST